MPSINDVLKEKFKVTGNNIAETLSKIEPGSGEGRLAVNLTYEYDESQDVIKSARLNKTSAEIIDHYPYVDIVVEKIRSEDPLIKVLRTGGEIKSLMYAPDGPVEVESDLTMYCVIGAKVEIDDVSTQLEFSASSPNECPEYINEESHS